MESLEQGRRWEEPDPGGSQLDCQGKPIETCHQCRHRRRVVRGDVEIWAGGAGTVDEEPDRFDIRDLDRVVAVWDLERGHLYLLLGSDPQRGPRGDEHAQSWGCVQQRGHPVGGIKHLLEVVEHQQDLASLEVVLQLLRGVAGALGRHPEHPKDGACDQFGIGHRVERHEEDAIWEHASQPVGGGDGNARLPGPSGAGERDHSGVLQERHHLCDLLASTHQRAARRRDSDGHLEGPQRGELGWQPVHQDLG